MEPPLVSRNVEFNTITKSSKYEYEKKYEKWKNSVVSDVHFGRLWYTWPIVALVSDSSPSHWCFFFLWGFIIDANIPFNHHFSTFHIYQINFRLNGNRFRRRSRISNTRFLFSCTNVMNLSIFHVSKRQNDGEYTLRVWYYTNSIQYSDDIRHCYCLRLFRWYARHVK